MRIASSIQDRGSLATAGLAGRPVTGRLLAAAAGTIALSLAVATSAVAILEAAGLEDASPVYLLAVVVVASAFGTIPAVVTGILAFVVYDVLFTEPRFSLVVADPREWLDLLLFLVVAVVIGRLVADQRRRADDAAQRMTELEVARQADVLKTALVDAVSHDLRTPLASIRATAGGLADPAVDWSDADRRSAAAVIDAEAARLDRLVGGLLDLGRIASGSIHPTLEPHEPWALVEPVVQRLRPAFGDRPVDIAVPVDLPPVLVDAALIDVVISNLLDNAIRHAPAPAALRILGQADGGDVTLTVEDGGPGVPAAALPHLFDRFWRAEGPSASPQPRPGMGIGLSVVRGLVEAMGGTVKAGPGSLGGLAIHVRLASDPDPTTADR